MRLPSVITYFLVCLLTTQNLFAQVGGWRDVAAEPKGTHLYIVFNRYHGPCTVVRVTDGELLCDEDTVLEGARELVVSRQELREVREVHGRGVKTVAGAVIGTAAGALISRATVRSSDAETQVYDRIGCALLGTLAGAVVGRISAHIHSKIIYKR